ncbi:MAG: hypothetical protein EON54_21205 [Alcaligenaceae bacterium]|nr:MAG: hypothetical protein EON54_21205 [Alcaligenaceae bacterium]
MLASDPGPIERALLRGCIPWLRCTTQSAAPRPLLPPAGNTGGRRGGRSEKSCCRPVLDDILCALRRYGRVGCHATQHPSGFHAGNVAP